MGWYPIGRSDDAPYRHVHQAKLLGRELAVWRGDDGHVNVWDNRCLHRGVRLSVGLNQGRELQCVYHGWRYANRTGGCTYVPAHPADAPARTIANRTFPAAQRYGLIWTRADGDAKLPAIRILEEGSPFALRSLPFDAAPELVVEHISDHYRTTAGRVTALGPYTIQVDSDLPGGNETVVLFVQPVDSGECVVHGVAAAVPAPGHEIEMWRRHADELATRRDEVEAQAATRPRPEPLIPALERTEPSEQGVPMPRARRDAELRVVVARKWATAEGVVAFRLESIGDPLPTTQPGAHIDVHLPNGLIRQYSLTNPAGATDSYVIGVKLEPDSRGGSACLHETVAEGDVLAVSAPRNNFTLRRDAVETVLVAGGIGITPLLAMAETLGAGGHPFRLHYFAQSAQHVAFADRLAALSPHVTSHLGLTPANTGDQLTTILSEPTEATHAYICGPGPMLDAALDTARIQGWPDTALHFEYFKNTTEMDKSSSFRISLARSGLTLDVNENETILEVLRANGIAVASSCEQGACGTCVLGVVAGDPVHQDVHLSPTERAAGDRIVTCVSRAASAELVLDV